MVEADLEQLYARLHKPVYNVVYRWVWNADEAHEIVQETFVRLWRMGERVRLETAEPLVYRIAINLASTCLRRRKRWRWLPLESLRRTASGQQDGEEAVARDEDRRRVREAVGSLPEDLRRVVMLCEFSDLTQAEIARLLAIPPGTVASRRHRALKLLRERLSRGEEADEDRMRPGL